jgi:hypothetical protein
MPYPSFASWQNLASIENMTFWDLKCFHGPHQFCNVHTFLSRILLDFMYYFQTIVQSSNTLLSESHNDTEQRKYGRLETEGHVGSVDYITQINTGRLYTYIVWHAWHCCATWIPHKKLASIFIFFFWNEQWNKIHVANAVLGQCFTSDKGGKTIGRGNDGCRNK